MAIVINTQSTIILVSFFYLDKVQNSGSANLIFYRDRNIMENKNTPKICIYFRNQYISYPHALRLTWGSRNSGLFLPWEWVSVLCKIMGHRCFQTKSENVFSVSSLGLWKANYVGGSDHWAGRRTSFFSPSRDLSRPRVSRATPEPAHRIASSPSPLNRQKRWRAIAKLFLPSSALVGNGYYPRGAARCRNDKTSSYPTNYFPKKL